MQPFTNVFEPADSPTFFRADLPPRRIRRRDRNPWGMFIAAMLGVACAWWLAANVIPGVTIHADEHGNWQWAEVDMTRTLLGGER